MPIYQFNDFKPTLAERTYVAPTAVLVGQVVLKAGANVWFGAVLRGDNEPITVGENSNIQENSWLHTDAGAPLSIGAIVLNHATIGANSIVGAGALVTEGKTYPEGVLLVGSPAKVLRTLTEEEIARLPLNAYHYSVRGQMYLNLIELNPNDTTVTDL